MRYEVVGRLGRGGMGVVDLGVDPHGNRVALKRLALHGSTAELATARARVRREAEVLAHLHHPGIVELVDVVDDGDDVVLVMAHMAGGSLADRVLSDGPLGVEDVLRIAGQLLPALAAAHRAGVVHRDIKPSNVLFDEEGRAHLSDFGVARLHGATGGLTHAGTVVGTPRFMAPEQARGTEVGPPADVFALGATLLFALTGRGPWGDGDARTVLRRAAEARPEVPRTLPPEVARGITTMLAVRPERRPSAAELMGGHDGTAVLDRRPARRSRRSGRERGTGEAARRTRSRPAWMVPTIAAAVAVGAGLTIWAAVDTADGTGASSAQPSPTSTPECVDLPYQPCGGPVAPNTDGHACTGDHADYDGEPGNGCEAAPDDLDGSTLEDEVPIRANLVPADDIDRYPFSVGDRLHLTCDGTLVVGLTAPEGVSMRLDVLEDGQILGSATSVDGSPAEVVLVESSCFGDDSADLVARVSWVGEDRSAQSYRLVRSGSF